MQEQLDQKETLSALLDGEAGGDAAKFLARRIEHDPEAAAQLGRWQFAGDALRARAAKNTEVDLRAALRQQLAADAAAAPVAVARNRKFSRKTAGIGAAMAMAAALGVVAFSLPPRMEAPNAPANAAPAMEVASTVTSRTVVPDETTQAPTATVAPVEPATVAVTTRSSEPEHVRPWRVPADADAMIARARTQKTEVTKSQPAAVVAAVPKTVKRSDDMERVLRGKSSEGALGTEAPAQVGWPRSVIPGIDGAYNASFNTGAATGFGQPQGLDAPKN